MIKRLVISPLIVIAAVATATAARPDISADLKARLDVALPYAVEAIKTEARQMNAPLSSIDREKLERLRLDSYTLADHENGLGKVNWFLNVVNAALYDYDAANKYLASELYDRAEVDRLTATLRAGLDFKMLSEAQSTEIETLINKLNDYPTALFCLEQLIVKSNEAVEPFSKIPDSEKIASDEINNVLAENEALVQFIKGYPALGDLLGVFVKAKQADPFAPVKEVDDAVRRMNGIIPPEAPAPTTKAETPAETSDTETPDTPDDDVESLETIDADTPDTPDDDAESPQTAAGAPETENQ